MPDPVVVPSFSIALAALAGYLLGSIPTGVLLARLFGWPDPRQHGSGHTGGLNSYRGGGIGALLLVAIGDVMKGIGAVLLAHLLTPDPWAAAAAGVAAIAGHNWPVWLGFRGGMGLATGAGVMALIYAPSVLIAGALWLALRLAIRHSPRASVIMAGLTPPGAYLAGARGVALFALVGCCLLILLRHLKDWNRGTPSDPAV